MTMHAVQHCVELTSPVLVLHTQVVNDQVTVRNSEGKEIEAQLLPIANASLNLREKYVKAYIGKSTNHPPKYWLAFTVSVPPLGFNSYFISSDERKGSKLVMSTPDTSQTESNKVEVGQGSLKLTYNRNGQLQHYCNSRNMVKEHTQQAYNYYSGDDGSDTDPQASGAYIFRPNGSFPVKTSEQSHWVWRGPIVEEIHQPINSWIYQITRVYQGKEHAEIEFIVGPIPVDDGVGKEVAVKITTTMLTNKTFYTDSNGRDFIKRVRDFRSDWNMEVNQPVAGNYYPINLGIYIEDKSRELSVMVDRSVGGSSMEDGQIELILHRRLLCDDSRGVAESLDEVVCGGSDCSGLMIQGKFYLRIDPLGEGAKWRRSMGQEIYSPLLLAFSEQDTGNWISSHLSTFTGMDTSYSLPENIAMITLQALEDGIVLFRLAHLYEVGEDKDLSVLAKVDLKSVFPDKKIDKITEMNLSANQEKSKMEMKRLVWKVEGPAAAGTRLRGGPVDPSKLVVELAPMEIRTFVIKFASLSSPR